MLKMVQELTALSQILCLVDTKLLLSKNAVLRLAFGVHFRPFGLDVGAFQTLHHAAVYILFPRGLGY